MYVEKKKKKKEMKFNIQKCKVLHLGKKKTRNFYLMFDNENKCLSTIKDIREQPDLGVQMDESRAVVTGGRGGEGGARPPNNFDNALFDFYKLRKMLKSISSVVI